MAYAIFEVSKENIRIIDTLKQDDLISRQSIYVRDAASLNMEGNALYLKIEGDEQAIRRAYEMYGKATALDGEKKERINKEFIGDEEKASEGMGFIFG